MNGGGPFNKESHEANYHCCCCCLVIGGLFDQPSRSRQYGDWAPRSSHRLVSRRHATALRAAQGLNGISRHVTHGIRGNEMQADAAKRG